MSRPCNFFSFEYPFMTNKTDEIAKKLVNARLKYKTLLDNLISQIDNISTKLEAEKGPTFSPQLSLRSKNLCIAKIHECRKTLVNQILSDLSSHFSAESQDYEATRKAKRFSKQVINVLEENFAKDKYPTESEKMRIANVCLISLKQVSNWYTNKRNRTKRIEEQR